MFQFLRCLVDPSVASQRFGDLGIGPLLRNLSIGHHRSDAKRCGFGDERLSDRLFDVSAGHSDLVHRGKRHFSQCIGVYPFALVHFSLVVGRNRFWASKRRDSADPRLLVHSFSLRFDLCSSVDPLDSLLLALQRKVHSYLSTASNLQSHL